MRYWITVYNPIPMSGFDEGSFIKAITQSDYHTLCEQYGLDEALIAPEIPPLSIAYPPHAGNLFFFMEYGVDRAASLAMYRWSSASDTGRVLLSEALGHVASERLSGALMAAQNIWGIEVEKFQLEDLGLLLAYEIARWAMHQGGGVMCGLDGFWYRLNRHQAFIPV
jgi:hypothetical protein